MPKPAARSPLSGCRAPWRLAAAWALASGCVMAAAPGVRVTQLVGATERVRVEQASLDFLARIDTGAQTTSLHALDLHVEDGASRMQANVGKIIRFRTVNEAGEEAWLSGVVADVVALSDWHGVELRYAVPLELSARGVRKRVLVNLRDRSAMAEKLLIGRDWLAGDFLVDVERNATE